MLTGFLAIGAFIAAPLFLGGQISSFLLAVAPIAYLIVSIVLAVRPSTTRFGAGMLISIGVWILVGAGLCVALISSIGR